MTWWYDSSNITGDWMVIMHIITTINLRKSEVSADKWENILETFGLPKDTEDIDLDILKATVTATYYVPLSGGCYHVRK